MIAAEVIADSMSPQGHRLTTMVVDMHRFVLAETNTHRLFSRNSASSRAIPLKARIEAVRTSPAMPIEWGSNRPGMQAGEPLTDELVEEARALWLHAANRAAGIAERMGELGLHKQVAARILEPFLWHRVVVSATSWDGFYAQRCSPLAQPEIRVAAEAMRTAMADSTPVRLGMGDWHLPFVTPEERVTFTEEGVRRMSVARCARVSYLNEGKRDPEADLTLYDRLMTARPIHASPTEHVATPAGFSDRVAGNFVGWHQLRHTMNLDRLLFMAADPEAGAA